jgi:membrane protein implicated in regulation of membrane protease activity
MIWWGWLIVGALLMGAELFAIDAQFYLVFLGVSAALVGLAQLFGIAMPNWVEWLVFGALSLILMVTFRRALYLRLKAGGIGYNTVLEGDTVDIQTELTPGGETRASYRGSIWTVKNTGENVIPGGSRVRVLRVDGVKLHVEL